MKKGRSIQDIRQSQYVLTYGPGAIVETKNGARLIPLLDRKGLLLGMVNGNTLRAFEITDTRLSAVIKLLLKKRKTVRIYTLPSAENEPGESRRPVYSTHVFPRYFVCYNSKEHRKAGAKEEYILFYSKDVDGTCPVCKSSDHTTQVRFITACPNGHMVEVDWDYAIHGDNSKCSESTAFQDKWFYWKPSGSSLEEIKIECPSCGREVTMSDIYKKRFRCSGRYPERELPSFNQKAGPFLTQPDRPYDCSESMRVIQRQSSSLHIPNTVTLLTIPQVDKRIAELLQNVAIMNAIILSIDSLERTSPEDFIKEIGEKLERLVNAGYLEAAKKEEFVLELKNNKRELLENGGLRDLLAKLSIGGNAYQGFLDYIYDEFESIMSYAQEGKFAPSERGNFYMGPPRTLPESEYTPSLRVYPVPILRTVTAQIGYTRQVGGVHSTPQPVDTGFEDHHRDEVWYPGFESRGEGIFITFNNPKDIEKYLSKNREAVNRWLDDKYHEMYTISPWAEIAHNPIFVWLHTLSHSIMKSIYMMSGYSLASIRERIYISRDGKNGGILLYTAAHGADGSMGGLVSIIPKFEDLLNDAIRNLLVCSNDPLCGYTRKQPESPNGAACYSCVFVSETSCEHGNRWLDRHIIVGDERWLSLRL